ncbi:MAG: KpsF/GutQ family sugar-phosphate isomerase [Pseudomonadota bacterium]
MSSLPNDANNAHVAVARRVIGIEADALATLRARVGTEFDTAVELCLATRGRVVVTGMGKSGHIGGKIAATLASTGTPAFFVHPGEASHGDLGMITPEDTVIAMSNSGESSELITILPLIRRLGLSLITLTGNANSTLARAATTNLDISVAEEACPLNLAPTASTTATLAMGDALAVALLEARGFTPEDFARSHPGGTLGKRLLLHISDIMRTGSELPICRLDTPFRQALLEMTSKGLGMTAIVDSDHRVVGIFTDGDLRRALDDRADVIDLTLGDLVKPGCKTLPPDALAVDAVRLFEDHKITSVLIVDESQALVGALNVHDLLRAGVM